MSVEHSQEPDPIEQLLLTAYPNPERKGCPGRDVLEHLASKERDAEDPHWYHVWHCSPCYADFKEMRDARWEQERTQQRSRARLPWIAAAAAVIVAAIVGMVWFSTKDSGSTSSEIAQVNVDLFDVGATRGAGQDYQIAPVAVPPSVDDFRITLPRFSDPGSYTIAVLRSKESGSALAIADGRAQENGRKLTVSVRFDLRNASAGRYLLGIRQAGREAQAFYYPLEVRKR
jgi:hypothetical protein